MINELPLYLHPTEVILIDDDVNYAKNVETVMLGKEVPIRIFNDPKKALSFIKERPPIKFINKSIEVNESESTMEKTAFNIDLNKLHHAIYNKDRFHEISTLIVDYAMPGLSGKEFFEKIKHITAKKILLTGEEGYETAVKIFNAGLINRFFRKSDDNLFQELVKEITTLKINFFQEISHSTLLALEKESPDLSFKDPVFIQFFLETVKQNEIVEYYALDSSGSYLLIDIEGKPMLLIVKTKKDMQVLYELAAGEDDTPKEMVEGLKNKKKLTFFLTKKESIAPISSWRLYDTTRLVGDNQSYYYTLIKNAKPFKLKDKIYSFAQFLEDNN